MKFGMIDLEQRMERIARQEGAPAFRVDILRPYINTRGALTYKKIDRVSIPGSALRIHAWGISDFVDYFHPEYRHDLHVRVEGD